MHRTGDGFQLELFNCSLLCCFLFDSVDFFVLFEYNIKRKDGDYMSITATELKLNLGKYLLLSETEDIYITKNGKVISKLSNPNHDRVEEMKSIFGVIPADVTLEEAREERLNKI